MQRDKKNWHFSTCPKTGNIDDYFQCDNKQCKCRSKNPKYDTGKKAEKQEKFLAKLSKKRK